MSQLCDFQILINGQQTFFVNEVRKATHMETALDQLNLLYAISLNELIIINQSCAGGFINLFREVEEDHQARKEKSPDQVLGDRNR
jgi:hypothetical protein